MPLLPEAFFSLGYKPGFWGRAAEATAAEIGSMSGLVKSSTGWWWALQLSLHSLAEVRLVKGGIAKVQKCQGRDGWIAQWLKLRPLWSWQAKVSIWGLAWYAARAIRQKSKVESTSNFSELDTALTKNNALIWCEAEGKWRNWTKGLNDYYQYPKSGLILAHHAFVFGNNNTLAK